MQIVHLTIAPAFNAAGIHLTLTRIVITVGPQNSRFTLESHRQISMKSDVVSLFMQATRESIALVSSEYRVMRAKAQTRETIACWQGLLSRS